MFCSSVFFSFRSLTWLVKIESDFEPNYDLELEDDMAPELATGAGDDPQVEQQPTEVQGDNLVSLVT